MTTPVIGNLEQVLSLGLNCLLISLALLSYRQRHAARRLLRLSDWRATAFAGGCGVAFTLPFIVEHPLPWQVLIGGTVALLCGVLEIRDSQRLRRGNPRPQLGPQLERSIATSASDLNAEPPTALGADGEVDRTTPSH